MATALLRKRWTMCFRVPEKIGRAEKAPESPLAKPEEDVTFE
jgi:hypothetical protein